MEAYSVMVGNILSTSEGLVKVTNVGSKGFEIEAYPHIMEQRSRVLSISGVPLSNEWKEKIGFQRDLISNRGGHIYRTKELGLLIGINNVPYLEQVVNDITVKIELERIDYLHELQNLCYVLMGIRLPVE